MGKRYFSRDAIIEKYDTRESLINCTKNLFAIVGGVYAVMNTGQDIEKMLLGTGVCLVSYFGGDYIKKMNNKMKEKLLKNLEGKAAA